MRELYRRALMELRGAFCRLERQVPPPQWVRFGEGFVYRYVEKTVQQALVQKLARIVSGLHAVDVLLVSGFVQEQSVISRTLDELGEDILFLVAALTKDRLTDLHEQYLTAFYDEEFDNLDDIAKSTQKRTYPPRKKIRAYVTRVLNDNDDNPSRSLEVGKAISKAYSGYVHAASPHIMDMCGGNPPRFYVAGMNGTPRVGEHVRDAWNYYYRGLLDTAAIALAFRDEELVESLYRFIREFESASGTDFSGHAKSNP